MERKFEHDKSKFWDSVGLDKAEKKRVKRKLEDIVDDLPEDVCKSMVVEAVYNAAKKDDSLFVLLIAMVMQLEGPTIRAVGGSELPEGLLKMLHESLGEHMGCDGECETCSSSPDKKGDSKAATTPGDDSKKH